MQPAGSARPRRAPVSSATARRVARWLRPLPWLTLAAGATSALVIGGDAASIAIRTALVVTMSLLFLALLTQLMVAAAAFPTRRLPLLVLAGAVALWATGSATVSAGQTVTAVTFPAPGEVLCFVAYLGLAAFLLLEVPRRARATTGVWLEAAVVCGGAVCLAAFAVLTPLSDTFVRGGLPLLLAVLYPLINLVLCSVLFAQVLLRQRERSGRTFALMLGFLGLAIADSSFIAGLSSDAYSANLVIDAVWGCSFIVIVGAACARPGQILARPAERAHGGILAGAAALAVIVLVLDPVGPVGWGIKIPAIITLVAAGARMVGALREARAAAEALRLSLLDELTGLPNRRAVMFMGDRLLERGEPVSVLLLDLDAFKDVNDSLGHTIGDQVLVSLGHRLRAGMDHRVVVARLGGDEFALLVVDEDAVRLLELARHAREILSEKLRVENIDLRIDASVGIAVRAQGDSSAAELLRRADVAMYRAKDLRAGALAFDVTQDGFSRDRLRRAEALRQAIDGGQLAVWYQPQIDARTRQVVTMEALVRWWHPVEGLLSPVEFLPDARRAGLMPALTETVVRSALEDARRWHNAGFRFRLAVNCAPPELVGTQVLPLLLAEVAKAGLPPETLIVEVTEDSFLSDPERARAALYQLRAHGIQVSIDDYGTGFSSLAYLRDLPVQELKMDRSFVAEVARDERSRMIVQTTTQMARAMGLRMVAEGVEDAETAAELLPLGVDVLQGYHIARPMPAEAVGPWVRQWTAELAAVPTARGKGSR